MLDEKFKYINLAERKGSSKTPECKCLNKLTGKENKEEAENVLGLNISFFHKKLAKFFTKYSSALDEKRKIKKYSELRNLKSKIVNDVIEEVENLKISQIDKKELLIKTYIFSLIHSSFAKQSKKLDNCVDKSRQSKKSNLNDIACAEAQQYIAMAIIEKPDLIIKEFENYRQVADKIYESMNIFAGIKRGIYGAAGAFHYYNKQGFSVIFPDPKLDANLMTDLILIDDENKKIEPGDKEKLHSIKWRKIENMIQLTKISKELRRYIYLAQIKCHEDSFAPTSEREYRAGQNEKPDYKNSHDPAAGFFKVIGETGFNCKYLDLLYEDAKNLINENVGPKKKE